MRAIRGAISVAGNTRAAILAAARDLLQEMVAANRIAESEMVSIFFTLTRDLDQAFPAEAARDVGFRHVPLLCMQEIPVPGALPMVLRVLMHIDRAVSPSEVRHVYMGEARELRPDLEWEGT